LKIFQKTIDKIYIVWYNITTKREEMIMDKKYIDYLFEDEESGELFFVEIVKDGSKSKLDCLKEAIKIAKENFDNPRYIEKVSPEVAETYGYDTY
jgi:hypothetical protein